MAGETVVSQNSRMLNSLLFRAAKVKEALLIALADETDEQSKLVIMDYITWADVVSDGVLGEFKKRGVLQFSEIADAATEMFDGFHRAMVDVESILIESSTAVDRSPQQAFNDMQSIVAAFGDKAVSATAELGGKATG